MSFLRNHVKLLSMGAVCAAAGAGASAIATAGAAGTATAPTNSTAASSAAKHPAVRQALARRAVHGDLVLATKTGFVTVTLNRGFVQSVGGNRLTIREGTKKATYKTVTLSIPANAKVRENGHTASLAQLTPGQRVGVVQGAKRTVVVARTPK